MPAVGLTPKVAKIHYDDEAQHWELRISWQLVTPLGVFPEMQETFTLGTLAAILDTIKTIWAIVTVDTEEPESHVNAPIGDWSGLGLTPPGMKSRLEVLETITPTDVGDIEGPDTEPDYDGESDDWGITPPS